MLERYEQPQLDATVEEELIEYVERRAHELGDPLTVRRGPVALAPPA
jgi:trimethylamine:corrinoid methyltransferase-like protein